MFSVLCILFVTTFLYVYTHLRSFGRAFAFLINGSFFYCHTKDCK